MSNPVYAVTVLVEVEDRSALYRAALARARSEGMTRGEWRTTRTDPSHGSPAEADLIMLLDPGSLAGCDIHETKVEEVGDDD